MRKSKKVVDLDKNIIPSHLGAVKYYWSISNIKKIALSSIFIAAISFPVEARKVFSSKPNKIIKLKKRKGTGAAKVHAGDINNDGTQDLLVSIFQKAKLDNITQRTQFKKKGI